MSENIHEFIKKTDEALQGFVVLEKRIVESSGWDLDAKFTMDALYFSALRSSMSSLILLEKWRVWDADILMRSVLESSMKIVFLLSSKDKFRERVNEFSIDLLDIEHLKQHKKVEELLALLDHPEDDKWRPLREMMLSDDLYKQISQRTSSKERRYLESK